MIYSPGFAYPAGLLVSSWLATRMLGGALCALSVRRISKAASRLRPLLWKRGPPPSCLYLFSVEDIVFAR